MYKLEKQIQGGLELMLIKNNITNVFKSIEQFKIGCKAVKGVSVTTIANEEGVSRQNVYEQKKKLEEQIDNIGSEIKECNTITIKIDDKFLKRSIILLALECSSGIEGIQRYMREIFNIHISIGKISEILKEASVRAMEFDKTIRLDKIRVGANDEVFQCNEAVLVGVDPKSTYTYLLRASKDRKAETWKKAFDEGKEAGLKLKISVNDGGTGLNKGIPEAFNDIEIQADVFHVIHEIGKSISILERKAMKLIEEEGKLENKVLNEKVRKGTWEKLKKTEIETKVAIDKYDIAHILRMWLCEMLSITGYSLSETKELLEYIAKELELVCHGKSLEKGIRFLRSHTEELLLFAINIDKQVRGLSKFNVKESTCGLMLRQLHYGYNSIEYNKIEAEIGIDLGESYEEIRELFSGILRSSVRASSMVENVNSRIRIYMNLKRVIPDKFLTLLKVYLNTKKYRRSRCKERVGKSPLDLLTGKDNPNILELLGY